MDTRLDHTGDEMSTGQGAAGISADRIRDFFDLPRQDIHSYSPLALAYIGDSIYDLIIRTMVVERGNTSANPHCIQQTAIAGCRQCFAPFGALNHCGFS